MWKGLRKALGKPGATSKSSKKCLDRSSGGAAGAAADTSTRSTTSSALFPLDLADVDALAAWQEASRHGPPQQQQHEHEQQQLHAPTPLPAGAPSAGRPQQQQQQQQQQHLTPQQLQQQLQQQAVLQQLVRHSDDQSASKRQAAAIQKRIDNAMLNPSTCLYQINSLLSLSSLFEHKLQRDAVTALRSAPSSAAAAAAAAPCGGHAAAAAAARGPSPIACERSAPSHDSTASAASFGSAAAACPCARTPSATAASTAHVALQLSRWGYRVIVRKVLHSKAYWTKAMDNTFIVALDTSSGGHVEYVVDPHFKEAFNVGVVSANYSAVWHSLPQVFVGMPCQLQPVVQLLCEEMELSFLEAGRPCPPWREWAATINRWMSDQYVDILVPEPGTHEDEVADFVARCCQPGGAAAAALGGGGSCCSSAATSVSTAPTSGAASPVQLAQARLDARLHVSSVLSSASTISMRPVQEPLHKQLGFDAACAAGGGADEAPPAAQQLRDVSFTSASSEASAAAGAALLGRAQHAAGAAGGRRLSMTGAHSLSVPSADICSTSSGSSGAGSGVGSLLDDGACFAAGPAAPVQQQHAGAEAVVQWQVPAARPAAAAAGGAARTKSLLTAHMQLKAQMQQQQRSMFAVGSGGLAAQHPAMCTVPAVAVQQQQLMPQHVAQLQHQLQHQQALKQHAALQQLQAQQQALLPMQQQQLQQQLHQMQVAAVGAPAPLLPPLQQQQQQACVVQPQQAMLAPLLPVVHTVRPCGAAPPLQEQQQQQQWATRGLQAAGHSQQEQEQPRLLRLIPRQR